MISRLKLQQASDDDLQALKDNIEKEVKLRGQTYRVGQRFMIGYSKKPYILSQVSEHRVCLISLDDGNRWQDSVPVEDIRAITKSEMLQITGSEDEFTEVK